MTRRLRIPAAIAFAIGSATSVATIAGVATSCSGKGDPPDDARIDSSEGCMLYCIPDGTDAGVCPSPPLCSDAGGCPAGCTPVG